MALEGRDQPPNTDLNCGFTISSLCRNRVMKIGATLSPTVRESPAQLLEALLALRHDVIRDRDATVERWQAHLDRAAAAPNITNLAAYLALRRHDLRGLQMALMPWGLSSLGRIESRVLPTLDAVIQTLAVLSGTEHDQPLPGRPTLAAFFEGEDLLERNTGAVFGPARKGRRVRIMATLPSEAATDYSLVRELLQRGADSLRINCAHDDRAAWMAMVDHGRRAAAELGTQLTICIDIAGQKPRIDEVIVPPDERRLHAGDRLLLSSRPLQPRQEVEFQARCSVPAIMSQLVVGVRVCFDDGKLITRIERIDGDAALLEVVRTSAKGKALVPDLGMNFPDTAVRLPVFTAKDLADLDFVAAQADAIGFSFVQQAEDVAALQEELNRRGRMPALIAKIETAQAVRHLPEIIIQALGRQPLAVMIARGDLAVEIGYQRLAEIQEEMLWICEAAHVPVVWATQVLERLSQKGMPNRAEITDAAMSERAECVMLNKGPHMLEAVSVLDDLLVRMDAHQRKKTPMLRALHSWDNPADLVPASN
ncbi:MAG TPA: pyruvate kinase [Candidatus Sulfotelmatobacter sp.]|nr:pyruvate kinase [Candidatus Sulfotelmatobacter sp.]